MDRIEYARRVRQFEGAATRVAWALLLFAMMLALSGCFTRTVFVPPGRTVMLDQDINGVTVWAKDANNKKYKTKVNLKAGWFVVPMLAEQEYKPE